MQTKKRAIYKQLRTNISFIEINGKRYDAITGQLIGAVKQAHSHIKESVPGRVIDGMVSPKHLRRHAHAMHKRTQRSKTLMRKAVPYQTHTKPAAHHELEKREDKLTRAKKISKSHRIRRFSPRSATYAAAHTKAANNSAHRKPLLSGEVISHKPTTASATVAARPLPSMVTSVSHQKLEQMLDSALLRADAHKQALNGHRTGRHRLGRRGWLALTIAIIGILAAMVLATWQYIPQASMKLASMRAGINGSIPAYTPSGFKPAGPAAVESGIVKITYKAGDGRSFVLSQQATNWDSSSLQANALPDGSKVQSAQVKGTTVFIYDTKNHATWVNNGVRFTLHDEAKLSADQLLKIAESL